MQIATLNSHALSVCECCDELIVGTDLHHVAALYEQHLMDSAECQHWHERQRVESELAIQQLREKIKNTPVYDDSDDDDEIICPHCGVVVE